MGAVGVGAVSAVGVGLEGVVGVGCFIRERRW